MNYILLLSGLFLGWSLGANVAGTVFGTAVETKMLKFKTAAWVASIFVVLGAVLQGGATSSTLTKLGSVNALAGSFTVALAAALSLFFMARIRIPVSSTQAVVGAIVGWNFFTGAFTDFSVLAGILSSWIVTPLLAALFTLVIFYFFNRYLNNNAIHIFRLDYYTRIGLLFACAFGAYSIGANNIASVMGMFVDASPFSDIYIGSFYTISSTTQLFLIGAIAIGIGIFTYSQKNIKTVGNDLFKLSPLTGLIVVISSSLVLFIFSSKSLANLLTFLHLPALPLVPVSSSQAIIGSIVGLSLSKGIQNMHYNVLGRISIGWIVSPVLAGLICFFSLYIVQNVFDQTVYQPSYYRFDSFVMQKLEDESVDIKKLSTLNGRTYESSYDLRSELNNIELTPRKKQKIAEYSFLFPLRVDSYKIEYELEKEYFTQEDIENLHTLNKKVFYHKWQLNDALIELSETWLFKTKNLKNNTFNKELHRKYDLMYQAFQIKAISID
ncbi:MAG: inorganic phosphate transporter [Candidatus Cloacimonadales bacterium]|jgi:PiT family inorganic phosphate transporter|nr:inorganic phosphate transporter [Candidatus Cloacimonadales bacterium]